MKQENRVAPSWLLREYGIAPESLHNYRQKDPRYYPDGKTSRFRGYPQLDAELSEIIAANPRPIPRTIPQWWSTETCAAEAARFDREWAFEIRRGKSTLYLRKLDILSGRNPDRLGRKDLEKALHWLPMVEWHTEAIPRGKAFDVDLVYWARRVEGLLREAVERWLRAA